MEVAAELGHEGGIGMFQVLTETGALVRRERELDGTRGIELLAELIELCCCGGHHVVRGISRLDVAAGERLLVINDEREQA